MNKSSFILAILVSLILISCEDCIRGVGEVLPETRSVEPFDELEINSFFPVSFRQIKNNEVDKVVITAQENLLPHIKSTVEDGNLIIDVESCLETDKDISVEIYGRNLRSLVSNGSGDFKADGKLSLQKLLIENNGSGDVTIKTDTKSIEIETNGSGDIYLDGSTDYLEVENNGSGDVESLDLRTFEAEIQLNGSGEVSVFAKENLDAEINGSGDIIHKGKAKVTKTLSGSGSLKQYK